MPTSTWFFRSTETESIKEARARTTNIHWKVVKYQLSVCLQAYHDSIKYSEDIATSYPDEGLFCSIMCASESLRKVFEWNTLQMKEWQQKAFEWEGGVTIMNVSQVKEFVTATYLIPYCKKYDVLAHLILMFGSFCSCEWRVWFLGSFPLMTFAHDWLWVFDHCFLSFLLQMKYF